MTIRVLVVDDSPFIRKAVTRMLSSEPDIEVIAHAVHGVDALEKLHAFAPDVITLDLEMPELDGLATLRRIMAERPTPVVLLSAYARASAARTLEALAVGAVDFVDKSTVSPMDVHQLGDELVRKLRAASRSHPSLVCPPRARWWSRRPTSSRTSS